MAGAGDDSGEHGEQTHAPRECMACRGSGSVTSNLGGTPSTVTCPWCRGSGTRIPEIDAQARWAEDSGEPQQAGSGASANASAEPARKPGDDQSGDTPGGSAA
jgi:hypothetical protein